MRKLAAISMTFVLLFTTLLFNPHQAQANSLRDDVVRIAQQYIGVPYLWAGTTPAGFDCSGFTQFVFREAGITLSRTTATQMQEGRAISRNNLVPGDLVFFNTTGVSPSHNGIYIGNNQFIHSGSSRGVEITSLSNTYWSPRYIGARRIIEDAPATTIAVPAPTPEPLPVGQFHDVSSGHWAYKEITNISTAGHIVGFQNSFFKPEENINRASAAAIMARVQGLADSNNNRFSDVPNNHWAVKVINASAEAGYIGGFKNGTFQPDAPITRAQVASIFERTFDLKQGSQTRQFTDVPADHWANGAIQKMASNGITVGYSDGSFRPDAPITRAEFTVLLHRVLEQQ